MLRFVDNKILAWDPPLSFIKHEKLLDEIYRLGSILCGRKSFCAPASHANESRPEKLGNLYRRHDLLRLGIILWNTSAPRFSDNAGGFGAGRMVSRQSEFITPQYRTLQPDSRRVNSKNKTSICHRARIHWEQQGTLVCGTGGETMSLRHQARWIIDLSPSRAKDCSLANLCTPCTEWGNGKLDQLSTWGKESLNARPGAVANYNYRNVWRRTEESGISNTIRSLGSQLHLGHLYRDVP